MKLIAIVSLFAALVVSQSASTAPVPTLSPLPSGQAPSTCLTNCVAGAFQSQIALTLANPCTNGTLSDGFSQCILGEKCPEVTLAPSWLSLCQFVLAELKVPLAPGATNGTANATQIIPSIDGSTAPTTTKVATSNTTLPTSAGVGLGIGFLSVIVAWVMLV